MIFRLTPEKVIDRVNALIDELGTYELRIQDYEEKAIFAARLGLASAGDDAQIREWRGAWDDISGTLCDARAAIRTGELDYRTVNAMLPSVKAGVRNFRRVLSQTDCLEAAGRNAARKSLGTK